VPARVAPLLRRAAGPAIRARRRARARLRGPATAGVPRAGCRGRGLGYPTDLDTSGAAPWLSRMRLFEQRRRGELRLRGRRHGFNLFHAHVGAARHLRRWIQAGRRGGPAPLDSPAPRWTAARLAWRRAVVTQRLLPSRRLERRRKPRSPAPPPAPRPSMPQYVHTAAARSSAAGQPPFTIRSFTSAGSTANAAAKVPPPPPTPHTASGAAHQRLQHRSISHSAARRTCSGSRAPRRQLPHHPSRESAPLLRNWQMAQLRTRNWRPAARRAAHHLGSDSSSATSSSGVRDRAGGRRQGQKGSERNSLKSKTTTGALSSPGRRGLGRPPLRTPPFHQQRGRVHRRFMGAVTPYSVTVGGGSSAWARDGAGAGGVLLPAPPRRPLGIRRGRAPGAAIPAGMISVGACPALRAPDRVAPMRLSRGCWREGGSPRMADQPEGRPWRVRGPVESPTRAGGAHLLEGNERDRRIEPRRREGRCPVQTARVGPASQGAQPHARDAERQHHMTMKEPPRRSTTAAASSRTDSPHGAPSTMQHGTE
jgi:hypothetical protein